MIDSNSKIMLITGTMFGGKSEKLIEIIEIIESDKSGKYIAFKPTNDTRDGLYISSRSCERKVKAKPLLIDNKDFYRDFNKSIFKFTVKNMFKQRVVIIDEVQFISEEKVKWIVDICESYDCIVIFSGLLTTFKQTVFESTKYLSDNYKTSFYHGDCNSCGEKTAEFNVLYLDGKPTFEGDIIHPGDTEYKVFCQKCYRKL